MTNKTYPEVFGDLIEKMAETIADVGVCSNCEHAYPRNEMTMQCQEWTCKECEASGYIEKAKTVLSNSSRFCDFLNDARLHGVPGAWSGSAYQDHPCGIVSGTIKMTNDWTTYDSCSIEITDGDGWNVSGICRDSRACGNPRPKPINGKSVLVWSDGRWVSDEFKTKLEDKILTIVAQAILIIEKSKEKKFNEEAAKKAEMKKKHDAAVSAAISKVIAPPAHHPKGEGV